MNWLNQFSNQLMIDLKLPPEMSLPSLNDILENTNNYGDCSADYTELTTIFLEKFQELSHTYLLQLKNGCHPKI